MHAVPAQASVGVRDQEAKCSSIHASTSRRDGWRNMKTNMIRSLYCRLIIYTHVCSHFITFFCRYYKYI